MPRLIETVPGVFLDAACALGFNQLAVSGPAIYHTKHAITLRGCCLRLSALAAKLACSYLPTTQLWHLLHPLSRALSQISSGFDRISL